MCSPRTRFTVPRATRVIQLAGLPYRNYTNCPTNRKTLLTANAFKRPQVKVIRRIVATRFDERSPPEVLFANWKVCVYRKCLLESSARLKVSASKVSTDLKVVASSYRQKETYKEKPAPSTVYVAQCRARLIIIFNLISNRLLPDRRKRHRLRLHLRVFAVLRRWFLLLVFRGFLWLPPISCGLL